MMELDEFKSALQSIESRDVFDEFITENLTELTELFYSCFYTNIEKYSLDIFYHEHICQSKVYKQFLLDKIHSKSFDNLLFLIGAMGERLAETGSTSVADHVRPLLPNSALKLRLNAMSKVQNVDDASKDYLALFPSILELLLQSEEYEETGVLQQINFLFYFFHKTRNVFRELGLTSQLAELKREFVRPEYLERYHFLNHESIKDLLDGQKADTLKIHIADPKIVYPSAVVETIFKSEINRKVFLLPGTKDFRKPMGFDSSFIRYKILDTGKTDFDVDFDRNVNSKIKVLFYCYFNMKKHYFTSLVVFDKVWPFIEETLIEKQRKPIFIDLGCGPLTSGIAIADLFLSKTRNELNFTYIGVDISKRMIEKAREFSKNTSLFHSESLFYFYENWNDIEDATFQKVAGSNNPFIVNASYLFASSRLNESDLAKFIIKLVKNYKNVHLIFQNPDRTDRNVKWNEFKKLLKFRAELEGVERVMYKTSRDEFRDVTGEDVYFEILTILE